LLTKNRKILLVWLFIFSTGNPVVTYFFGNIFTPFFFLITFFISNGKLPPISSKLRLYILLIFIIFFVHGFTLYYISTLAYVNFVSKILFGWYVYTIIGKDFSQILLKVVTQIAKISLICFVLINLLGLSQYFPSVGVFRTLLFYNTIIGHEFQNFGILWEPGAFAGLLVFAILLNINQFITNIRNFRSNYYLLMLTILTTQSTGGYFFLFVLIFFSTFKKIGLRELILSIIILILSFYAFTSFEFLGEKIIDQKDAAEEQEIGEFSNTRFGSWYFDLHYIIKRPFFGNGFDEMERYSDHREVYRNNKNEVDGNGNSISNTWAKIGGIFILFYFFTVYLRMRRFFSIRNSSLVILILLLMFQHEDWFNFPLFLSLNFINLEQNGETT
jgi:hypothetical protein